MSLRSVVYLFLVVPVKSAAPYPHLLQAKATILFVSTIFFTLLQGVLLYTPKGCIPSFYLGSDFDQDNHQEGAFI